jgi:hypothetical protein
MSRLDSRSDQNLTGPDRLGDLEVTGQALSGFRHARGCGCCCVEVAFLTGEQITFVKRPGLAPVDAVRALLVGPIAAESKSPPYG